MMEIVLRLAGLTTLLSTLGMSGCLMLSTGCGPKATTIEEYRTKIGIINEVAKEQGMEAIVTVDFSGAPGLSLRQDFLLDSGVHINGVLSTKRPDVTNNYAPIPVAPR